VLVEMDIRGQWVERDPLTGSPMSVDEFDALSRTAQLIRLDVFGGEADEAAIIEGLRSTTVRIVADGRNVGTPAGQTAVAALYGQVAMIGLRVDLDVADVPLEADQPPLRRTHLATALEDYGANLIPWGARPRAGAPAVTFVIGDTPWQSGPAFRLHGGPWTCRVESADRLGAPWDGNWPFGALAAGAAGAAEAFRAALPAVAATVGAPIPPQEWWVLDLDRPVDIDIAVPGVGARLGPNVGAVDLISGGAIMTSTLYVLLRVPSIRGELRVIEPEAFDLPNLNRYPLMRRADVDRAKAQILTGWSAGGLQVEPIVRKLDEELIVELRGLRPSVCIGVDDIPSRWAAQRAAPGWVCVGATSHGFVMVTTHRPEGPCAGCAHPRDSEDRGPIPTISFVSFWAGLMQARALLANAANVATDPSVYIAPFAMFGPRAIHPQGLTPNQACPVGCLASQLAT
jgi:hypothetical protein